jgi:hypothetical protein
MDTLGRTHEARSLGVRGRSWQSREGAVREEFGMVCAGKRGREAGEGSRDDSLTAIRRKAGGGLSRVEEHEEVSTLDITAIGKERDDVDVGAVQPGEDPAAARSFDSMVADAMPKILVPGTCACGNHLSQTCKLRALTRSGI